MSTVQANIDADFQITYVFNGIEHVGSTETILSGTQMSILLLKLIEYEQLCVCCVILIRKQYFLERRCQFCFKN